MILILLVFFIFSDVMLIPRSIISLHISQSDFMSYDFNHFISMSDYDPKDISEIFTELEYVEQMGSTYIFKDKKSQEVITITSQQYTRYYKIWTLPMNF